MDVYTGGPDLTGDIHPNQRKLLERISSFLSEVKKSLSRSPTHLTVPRTPGKSLENRLNQEYGAGSTYYKDFTHLIKVGIEEGWAANIPIDGTRYRRFKLSLPCEATRFCSVTTVYMSTVTDERDYKGQYHAHPYGEINCVIPIDEQGQGKGWMSPHGGSHQYPQVRGGALVALFFLPAGRISYNTRPGVGNAVSFSESNDG
ncbi:hypothetical protein C8R43DRAFT_158524 [Mycena crocata]|nr:hypothetical protein C8R43DRAFT_158524 [Mycena crocata]